MERHFQQNPPQPHQRSMPFRDMHDSMNGQISPPVVYFDGSNLPDRSQHPPYVPPFQVVGLVPVPVEEATLDLQWNYGLEPKKRPEEQDFLENNSQISSVDFLQRRSVSTGLGLSLDNGRLASSGDSSFLGLSGDDIERKLQRLDAEIDRYVKVQGDQLRQAILEKVQASQLQTISYLEEKIIQKLHEKEAEAEYTNKKNLELEIQMEKLAMEANAWQQQAKYNENLIHTLKFNLQQVYAQNIDSKEGCGDSEVDDTASCCNGRAIDFHLLSRDKNGTKELMTCKFCRVNEVCMLLFPCRHLCLCKECESKLRLCPVCQSSKYLVKCMKVYSARRSNQFEWVPPLSMPFGSARSKREGSNAILLEEMTLSADDFRLSCGHMVLLNAHDTSKHHQLCSRARKLEILLEIKLKHIADGNGRRRTGILTFWRK